MDSQDQALEVEQSVGEQPKTVETPQKINIGGEEVDIEELKKGYMRQSDYTKKTQELSKIKKESTLTDDERNAIEFLKNSGFATKEDLEQFTRSQAQEVTLQQIMSENPDLKPYEQAIKDLSKTLSIAPEDVIEKYGFKSKDKLSRAKEQGDVKGSLSQKQKSISEMNDKEYAEYKAKMGFGQKK